MFKKDKTNANWHSNTKSCQVVHQFSKDFLLKLCHHKVINTQNVMRELLKQKHCLRASALISET